MNDENKVPVPDEAQASPAHAEDDIATLEREARVKREAELLNAQDDEEKDPVQPAVNKLKKRKRGKATAFLAIVAVALIFLAWGGNWVYRNILWQPTEEKKQDSSAATPPGQPQNTTAPSQGQSPAPVRRIPYNPDLYIPENTSIPCSLDRRFVSDRAGKLRCTVTTDIWSASGNTKLIEKGTTASLLYRAIAEEGMRHGQGRAFIIATKLRTRQPPYLDIPLVDTSAAGELGEAGVDGWIDSHFWERFGGALMVGMIPDIAAWASNSAGKKGRNTDYTENSRQAMADMARTTLENSINIPPTLHKNQGEIINLITGEDIDFSNIYTLRLKNDR